MVTLKLADAYPELQKIINDLVAENKAKDDEIKKRGEWLEDHANQIKSLGYVIKEKDMLQEMAKKKDDELELANAKIAILKEKLEAERGYSAKIFRELHGRQQHGKDIRFRVDYFDNSCGNALELFTNSEMIVSEKITAERPKEVILNRIYNEIKNKLGIIGDDTT